MSISTFSKKQLTDVIEAFSCCTEIPITVYDKEMKIIAESLCENKICKHFDVYKEDSICTKNLDFSAKIAFQIGEPYIFSCPSDLVNVAVAIINNKKFDGCFIAGPIAMGPLTEMHIDNILKINNNQMELYPKVTLFIRNMRSYTPNQVSKIALLLYNNILSLYSNKDEYTFMNEKFKSQTQISETIQKYKKNKKESDDKPISYNIQKDLVKRVKDGDSKGAHTVLQTLLNEILLLEAGSFEIMKVRIFEIYFVLSREAVESGAPLQKIFGIDLDLFSSLNSINDIHGLSRWASTIIDHFINDVFATIYIGKSFIINQAVQYIGANYMNKMSLRSIANHLHINESYLSKLFKREVGVNFTDYLNETRIKKSIEMIKETDMNLLDISIAVGFEDQSYFTKIFKKFMGQTPKHYKFKQNDD